MDGWISGWMDRGIKGNEGLDGWIKEYKNGLRDVGMDGVVHGWISEWMYGWIIGCMNYKMD